MYEPTKKSEIPPPTGAGKMPPAWRRAAGTPPGQSAGASMEPVIEALYRNQFEPLIAFLLATFGAGPPEPEDIVQKAYGQLIAADNLNDIDNLKAYLWRTARNIAVSEIRSLRSAERHMDEIGRESSDEACYLLTPERVLKGKEAFQVVMRALRTMPGRRRRAFVLTRIEGLSHAETARRLGISRPAVTSYVAAATAYILAAVNSDE